MSTVYISGPMRGLPSYNFPAFDHARNVFLMDGWKVISPADMDRISGVHEDQAATKSNLNPEASRIFAQRDAEALINKMKAEDGDAIAILPGWENSIGAVSELFIARWVGLKVFEVNYDLPPKEGIGYFEVPMEEMIDRWTLSRLKLRGLLKVPVSGVVHTS